MLRRRRRRIRNDATGDDGNGWRHGGRGGPGLVFPILWILRWGKHPCCMRCCHQRLELMLRLLLLLLLLRLRAACAIVTMCGASGTASQLVHLQVRRRHEAAAVGTRHHLHDGIVVVVVRVFRAQVNGVASGTVDAAASLVRREAIVPEGGMHFLVGLVAYCSVVSCCLELP